MSMHFDVEVLVVNLIIRWFSILTAVGKDSGIPEGPQVLKYLRKPCTRKNTHGIYQTPMFERS